MLIYVRLETTRILWKVLGILVGCEGLVKWGDEEEDVWVVGMSKWALPSDNYDNDDNNNAIMAISSNQNAC